MPAKKRARTRNQPSRPVASPAAVTPAPLALAKDVGAALITITEAWSRIREIAHDELRRLAGTK